MNFKRKWYKWFVLVLAVMTPAGCLFVVSDISVPLENGMLHEKLTYSENGIESKNLSVLVWNVYKGNREQWVRDFRQISLGCDFVLLQEAFLNEKMLTVLDMEGMGWTFAKSFVYTMKRIPTGVLTASASAPEYTKALRSPIREPVINTPKMSLMSTYPLNGTGKSLMVVNIHGINFAGWRALKNQLRELEVLMAKHEGPVIFAGDFNTWRVKRLKVLQEMVNRLDLRQATFDPDYRTRVFGHPLDHIFFRELSLEKAEVFENIASSDHKPILARFTVK